MKGHSCAYTGQYWASTGLRAGKWQFWGKGQGPPSATQCGVQATTQLYSQSTSMKGFVDDLLKLARSTKGLDLRQVDPKVFKLGAMSPLPMDTVEVMPGVVLHYCHPAKAIPFLFYHPALHQYMWRQPAAKFADWTTPAPQGGAARAPQQRVYAHPFTCDAALEAWTRMPPGLRHVLVVLLFFKDKTQLGRGEKADFDAWLVKLANTGDKVWWRNESKLLLAVFPELLQGDMSDDVFKQAKDLLYQICTAFMYVLLEDLAVNGLRCNHR